MKRLTDRRPAALLSLLALGCSWISASDQEARMDLDQDGVTGIVDCDDADAAAHPDAAEIPYDGVDQDCDGVDLVDVDGDGYDAVGAGGDDCDDEDAATNPDATEIPYDTVDQDCAGGDLVDADDDGHDAESAGGDDCDDTDAAIHPGTTERCGDGIDQDCDGGAGACAMPADTDVDAVAVHLAGAAAGAHAGHALAGPGDVDGDGLADGLLGVPGDGTAFPGAGAVYLVPGPWSASGTIPDTATLALTGTQADSALGGAIAWLGDANGDGNDDFAIAEPLWDAGTAPDVGRVHFLAGPLGRGLSDVSLAAADSFGGLQTSGAYGFAMAGGRDLDGSGGPDVAIGEPGVAPGVYGTLIVDEWSREHVGLAAEIDAWLPSTYLGYSVALADTNGDGVADLLAGTPADATVAPNAGAVEVIAGPLADRHYVEDVSLQVLGLAQDDQVGTTLCALGDVDGDGREDLAAGAADAGTTDGGAVYLLLGRITPVTSVGEADLTLTGADGARAGASLALAGDVDGDAILDLVVGAPGTADGAGAAYVVSLGLRGSLGVDDAGTTIRGVTAGASLGADVGAVGDLTGDDTPDFLVAAPDDDSSALDAGMVYLLPGFAGI